MFNTMLNLFRDTGDDKIKTGMPQLMPATPAAEPLSPAQPTSSRHPVQGVPPADDEKFRVAYDSTLIATLEHDHKHMLEIYGQIDRAASQHQWDDVPGLLLQFRSKLTDHLLKEGVKLYAYLHNALRTEDEMTVVFMSFKKEMGQIGKVVFNFFDRYAAKDQLAKPEQRAAFLEEFRSIGGVLVSRIQREEEQLYAIYTSLRRGT